MLSDLEKPFSDVEPLVKLSVFEFSADWVFVFDRVLLDDALTETEAEAPNAEKPTGFDTNLLCGTGGLLPRGGLGLCLTGGALCTLAPSLRLLEGFCCLRCLRFLHSFPSLCGLTGTLVHTVVRGAAGGRVGALAEARSKTNTV